MIYICLVGYKLSLVVHDQHLKNEVNRMENIRGNCTGDEIMWRDSCFSYLKYVCSVSQCKIHFLFWVMFAKVLKMLASSCGFVVVFYGIWEGLRYFRGDWNGKS